MSKVNFEFSAGGIVVDENKLLVIKVKNLKNKFVWTFPKGHIEKKDNESAQEAALREVKEETGYECEIIKPLDGVEYWFKENGSLIKKSVKWFLMKPSSHKNNVTEEVEEVRWINFVQARELLSYKSDRDMILKVKG